MATSLLTPTNRLFRIATLTDAATVTPDADVTDIGEWTIAGNRTLAAPTATLSGPRNGQQLMLRIKQDTTGGRTISWNSIYTFPAGMVPVLSTTAASVDVFAFQYNSGTSKWECLGIQIADLAGPQSVVVHLDANSANVNASTTLVDTGLSFPVIGGQRYVVDGIIQYSSGATPDIKFALVPTTATLTGKWSITGTDVGGSNASDTGLAAFGSGNTIALSGHASLQVTCRFSASFTPDVSGTVKLQFAQNTSNASNTFIAANSYLRYQVIGSALPGSLLGLSALSGNIVGKRSRSSNSSAFSTIARILSVRGPIKNGRSYRVVCQGEVTCANAGVVCQHELRYTVDDTEPATSSTVLDRGFTTASTAAIPEFVVISGYFAATADGYLRVAMCSTRAIGSGNAVWECTSSYPMVLVIEDMGPTISEDTNGVVY